MKLIITLLLFVTSTSFLNGKPVSIFNGKDFTGWEGPLEWFRIEDGAIVGGNLKGEIPKTNFSAPRNAMVTLSCV